MSFKELSITDLIPRVPLCIGVDCSGVDLILLRAVCF